MDNRHRRRRRWNLVDSLYMGAVPNPALPSRSPAITACFAPIDAAAAADVEALLDRAFGADRHRRTAYRLRTGAEPVAALSEAAFEDDRLVATLQSWPVELVAGDDAPVPLVLVGPVAVDPHRQRSGLGRQLMTRMLAAADRAATPLVLIGDAIYYGRFFGFSAATTGGWRLPGPVERERLLARVPAGIVLPRRAELRGRPAAVAVSPIRALA